MLTTEKQAAERKFTGRRFAGSKPRDVVLAQCRAQGVQVVAAPAGTGAEASITPVDTTAMKEHRRVMDAEVLLHALRRMTISAMRDVAEIERLRDRARIMAPKPGDNPE